MLGAAVSPPQDLPEHGVRLVFVELPNSKVELLAPLGEGSPVAAFLARGGGLHHMSATRSTTSLAARDRLLAAGLRVLAGDGDPRIGAHGKPVIFLHPKDFLRHPDRAGAGLTPGEP